MQGRDFTTFVYASSQFSDAALAIAATRAGSVGVVNAEMEGGDVNKGAGLQQGLFACLAAMEHPQTGAKGAYGLKIRTINNPLLERLEPYIAGNLKWLIVDAAELDAYLASGKPAVLSRVRLLAECITPDMPECVTRGLVDGVVIKGNESGGFVGEDSSFILLQHWAKHHHTLASGKAELPLYVRGGVTPHVAAAVHAMGVAGAVLDSQVLLLEESPAKAALQKLLGNLSGSETVAVGDGEKGLYFRVLKHPQLKAAKAFIEEGEGLSGNDLRALVARHAVNWAEPKEGLLPVGHDVCFAEEYRKRFGTVAKLLKSIRAAVEDYVTKAAEHPPIVEGGALAEALGTRLPIIQGPMTRVSDTAGFARAVAEGGALPMLAFALMKGGQIEKLLQETRTRLAEKPWGIGLLGFVPPALLKEQIDAALPFKPNYAIIAGGRPDQAVALEAQGIPSFLHLPSANLLANFLKGGARRFIFEGRECGGHIGPLSSFTLWSTMIDRLLVELDACGVPGEEVQCIFAGGIHDAYSSALMQVMVAPLIEKGVRIGIIMGSAYLFTKEIVASGAIVEQFQKVTLACTKTVNLESGPGHASRCAYTPFAETFFRARKELKGTPADEAREKLDEMILGTLRVASKGAARKGNDLVAVDREEQEQTGMYMLGQVVPLRSEVLSIDELHAEVTEGAKVLLGQAAARATPKDAAMGYEAPADIAIVGIGCALPGAATTQEYWENILAKLDAVTEVPRHRWDWRLYFDENRHAKDKVYSRWGGFLADMPFDPAKYGITPKSIASVDPMQLMALEVAHAAMKDAGFDDGDAAARARTSVIVGASGGAGDVGLQYSLRSEMPRFTGILPENLAEQLPAWSEDTFAGILINVVAGRIANRLNLGGTNYTTDAACASSLSAVYQAVNELQSGRSDVVIAGGVDTVQSPFGYMCFSQTQALSPRGRCRSFDQASDGIVISEGIVMLVLKRLEDAERDGDRVYAVLKGIGAGSDGKAKGLSAPEPAGQLRAMRRAYEQAGFGPETVRLFEAHGTGTVAGDTAELESTSTLMRENGAKPRSAVVGSVKTMIGHTKATAGIAGMLKAALALHHKVLPPHMGVDNPNKVLRDKNAPLYLLDEAEPWLNGGDMPRRAAVSAFGFGGTNFHAVMEEYRGEYRPWRCAAASNRWPAELFLWSAPDVAALAREMEKTLVLLEQNPDVAPRDLAYALAKVWSNREESVAIVAESFAQLAEKIATTLDHLKDNIRPLPSGAYSSQGAVKGKLAALFPGQGSQYTGMARAVAVQFPVVSETLSEADRQLAQAFGRRFGEGVSLSHFIFPRGAYDQESRNAAVKALTSTDVAQPALGAVEAGLWRLMCDFGLKAEMMAGHSYGEFVALWAAGRLDFEDLMAISEARGRLIVDKAKEAGMELGTMAAVRAKRDEVEEAIANIPGVVVANHNAPKQVIISGSVQAIEAAARELDKRGRDVMPIAVAAAFHSSFVEPARGALAKVIDGVEWREGSGVEVYSNNLAEPHGKDVKEAMAAHLTGPVEFVAEINAMYQDGARVFLEVGPKSVLTRLVGKILEGKPHVAVALDDREGGIPGLLHAMAQLLTNGVELDVMRLFDGRDCLEATVEMLASAERHPAPPKHAWMLNGSGARRVHEPVRQIGRTAEQLVADQPVPAAAPVQVQPQAHSSAPSRERRPSLQSLRQSKRKERITMSNYKQEEEALLGGSVAQAYFDLVARQLDNARDVALAELGAPPVSFAARPQTARVAAPLVRSVAALPAQQAVPAPRKVVELKAAPAPQAVPAVKPAPVAAAPVAEVKAAPAASNNNTALDEAKLKQIMLGVVTEKTGYEADMIAFNQNLEADLGVDSIKRVDIVGGVLDALPPSYVKALGDEGRSKLSTSTTLEKMQALLLEAGKKAVNFNEAGAGINQAESTTTDAPRLLPRLSESRAEVVAEAEALPQDAKRALTVGSFLITPGRKGVAKALASMIEAKGGTAHLLPESALSNEATLVAWCESEGKALEPVAGVVHLAALDAETLTEKSGPESWKEQLFLNEKALFLLVKQLRLKEDAHVLAVSGLGGLFARDGGTAISLQGGAVGMIKSLGKEREKIRGRAVDLDLGQDDKALAQQIFDELELVGGRIEVGYPKGKRTIFRTVLTKTDDVPPQVEEKNLVVLATGGARGVTAEVLREIAKPGNTLILTGRSALPKRAETLPEQSSLVDEKDLAKYFVKNEGLALGEARKKAGKVIAAREMLDNIADFEAAGAKVIYIAVDVADEAGMKAMFASIYKDYGKLDGIVHGAGIIEDKFLADIPSESWSRVVETKVIGLMLLQKYAKMDALKFFAVFSSVAGRYGNTGQSNYATANELMNRICCRLKAQYPALNMSALNWGPWGRTKFGAGMVTEATEAKFAKHGVYLVHAELGRFLFRHQLTAAGAEVEVICGKAPWEESEAAKGAFVYEARQATGGDKAPMLGLCVLETQANGDSVAHVHLHRRDAYLQDHIIDGTPVLPMAVAQEMMAEAVAKVWGEGWKLVEVTECQLFKGVMVDREDYPLTIRMTPTAHGMDGTMSVKVKIVSHGDKPLPHYGATVHLAQAFGVFDGEKPAIRKGNEKKISAREMYDEWLFHGPCFQVIKDIEALSEQGARCRVLSSEPCEFKDKAAGGWLLDPALVDAAAHMSVLWMDAFRDLFALPVKFSRVVRYAEVLPREMVMDFVVVEQVAESLVADVTFSDTKGNVLLVMEGMRHLASKGHATKNKKAVQA